MEISLNRTYLLLLFYAAPFIDAFSGYLILSGTLAEGGAGSPSQIFRFSLLLFGLILSLQYRKYFFMIVLLTGYIIAVEFIFYMIHFNIYGYIIGLIYGNKLVYLVIIFATINIMLKNNILTYLDLIKHIRNYVAITSIILLFSFIFGIGFKTYGEGTFGFKGFFAAGNGLGIFQGIGLLLSIYYWKLTQEKYSLLLSFIIMFATLIIGSKTALVLTSIGFVSIIFLFENRYVKVLFTLMILLILGLYIDKILNIFLTIFDVILFRFGNSDSILSWIFSNRDNYFIDAINTASFSGFFVLRFLIGFGTFISFRDPSTPYSTIDVLESDFADIFFMYGIFFILAYLLFIIFHLSSALIHKKFFLSLIFLLLMGHSLLAGHVIFNGMSGILVPLVSLLILNSKQGIK